MLRLLAVLWLIAVVPVATAARGAAEPTADSTAGNPDAPASMRERLRYDVALTGADGALRERLVAASRLFGLRDRAPFSDLALERRAEADMERLNRLLESEGYYAGRASFTIQPGGDRTTVTVAIDPGPQFKIDRAELVARPDGLVPGSVVEAARRELEALINRPARAADVIAAEDAAVRRIQAAGFPEARRADRAVVRDPVNPQITLAVTVEAGPFARFGRVNYQGLERTRPEFLDGLAPWTAGAPADPARVEEFADALRATNIFGSVAIEGAVADGGYNLDVEVREAPARTLSASANFSRDKGPGGALSWSHRNLLGRGERLTASIDGNQLEQSGGLQFSKPSFLRRDQSLDAALELRHTDADAFEEEAVSAEVAVSRKFRGKWIASLGVGGEIARLEDAGGRNTSYLLSVPARVSRDLTDDLLDPTTGYKLGVETVPYLGSFAGTASFVRLEGTGSVYRALDTDRDWVAAARARVGSLLGQALAVIPQNQRLYAGGGGSVRGFEFQFVGPLNAAQNPTGGRSVVEAGLELRVRLSPTIGVVPFIDAGAVSASSRPFRDATVRYGAGLGVRYYTEVGPLRLDLAVPLNRRRGVDPGFQFYISFGQSF